METTFHNVTITVSSENPKEAYTKLCNALASDSLTKIEYNTDTFSTEEEQAERQTSELFPNLDDETPTEPKTLTRDEAIEELTDWRLEDHDSTDRRDWLINGRIGYAEMDNATLAELYADAFDLITQPIITGREPKPNVEKRQVTDFLRLIARMKTSEEYGEEGMSGDDAVMALSELIATARTLAKE